MTTPEGGGFNDYNKIGRTVTVQASFPPTMRVRKVKAHVPTLQLVMVTCNPQATLTLGVKKNLNSDVVI